MMLRNIKLSLSNIAENTGDKALVVVGTRNYRKRLDDGSFGRELEYYGIECRARKGDTITVKVPISLAQKVSALNDVVNNSDSTAKVTFSNLMLRVYAMQGEDGKVYSGVSAKADDFDYKVLTDALNDDDLIVD